MARARQARGLEEDFPRGPVPSSPVRCHPPRHGSSACARGPRPPGACGATRAPGKGGREPGG
eukprot:5090841-Alexandrium_andersonii.AAC.1